MPHSPTSSIAARTTRRGTRGREMEWPFMGPPFGWLRGVYDDFPARTTGRMPGTLAALRRRERFRTLTAAAVTTRRRAAGRSPEPAGATIFDSMKKTHVAIGLRVNGE